MIESLALVVLQSLVPIPSTVEAGQPIRVQVRDATGAAVGGAPVTMVDPDGTTRALGISVADGALSFSPARVGPYRLLAELEGVRLAAPVRVVPAPPRWWLGGLGAVLGISLLVAHLRWFRAGRRSDPRPP